VILRCAFGKMYIYRSVVDKSGTMQAGGLTSATFLATRGRSFLVIISTTTCSSGQYLLIASFSQYIFLPPSSFPLEETSPPAPIPTRRSPPSPLSIASDNVPPSSAGYPSPSGSQGSVPNTYPPPYRSNNTPTIQVERWTKTSQWFPLLGKVVNVLQLPCTMLALNGNAKCNETIASGSVQPMQLLSMLQNGNMQV
jgi:hypothetical protein